MDFSIFSARTHAPTHMSSPQGYDGGDSNCLCAFCVVSCQLHPVFIWVGFSRVHIVTTQLLPLPSVLISDNMSEIQSSQYVFISLYNCGSQYLYTKLSSPRTCSWYGAFSHVNLALKSQTIVCVKYLAGGSETAIYQIQHVICILSILKMQII